MAYSRFKKTRRQARTLPLKGNLYRGDGLDANRYYRCWNCGFICNTERDALGDIDSRAGTSALTYYLQSYGSADRSSESSSLCVLGGSHLFYHTVLELGADGQPKPVYHPKKAVITSGCPFCGTLNWRGDYP